MHLILPHFFHLLPVDLTLVPRHIDAVDAVIIRYADVKTLIGAVMGINAEVSHPAPAGYGKLHYVSVIKRR